MKSFIGSSSRVRRIKISAVLSLMLAMPTAHAVAVYTDLTASPLTIANNIAGTSLNLVTGANSSSDPPAVGYDINSYNNGVGLTFYGARSPSGILANGTPGLTAEAVVLSIGDVVGPTPPVGSFYNQFQTRGTGFQSMGNRYVGFRFLNEDTDALNYGWLLVGSGADAGFPAAVLGYAYENTGRAIVVGQDVPPVSTVSEPNTVAMLSLGIAALVGLRVRRQPVDASRG